jgi:hypothetical protein
VIANFKKAGLTQLWGNPLYRYKAQQMGYAMVHMYDCPSGRPNMKRRTSMAIIMQAWAINALSQLITSLHPDDRRKLLDPTISAPAIELFIAKSYVTCDITTDVYTLPDLVFMDRDGQEIPYNGLDDIYIRNDEILSDDDFFEFKRGASAELENFKGFSLSDLPDPTGETDEIACRLWEGSKTFTRYERYKNARFGNRPMNQNGSSHATPFCVLCDIERECVALTRKNRTKPA